MNQNVIESLLKIFYGELSKYLQNISIHIEGFFGLKHRTYSLPGNLGEFTVNTHSNNTQKAKSGIKITGVFCGCSGKAKVFESIKLYNIHINSQRREHRNIKVNTVAIVGGISGGPIVLILNKYLQVTSGGFG